MGLATRTRGFRRSRGGFADALVAEAKRLDLDGIDVDLEGNGSLDADKDAFVRFVRELSTRAHAADMHVTVDSFPDIWNAPSKSWWSELFPLVDALTTMGYEETGAQAAGWRAYSAQKTAAGENAAKFLLGVPASKNEWQHGKAIEQLRAVRDTGVGVALWDEKDIGTDLLSDLLAEIKGVRANTGGIRMTNNEFDTAEEFRDKFCLAVVSQIEAVPRISVFFDPLSELKFKRQSIHSEQVFYSMSARRW